jgi:hypothetical protein
MVYLTTREAMLRSTFFGQLLLTMAMSVRARALHCGALRGGARERNWQWARLPPPTFVVFRLLFLFSLPWRAAATLV